MNTIKHRIVIETTVDKVFKAITTEQGLSGWWTKTETQGNVGSVARFLFGPNGEHVVEMTIMELVTDSKVVWKCTAGPWADTGEFVFTIAADERGAALVFEHQGWPEQDDFYAHCNAKWGFFLAVSLKSLLETGTGQPHPKDPNI